jgi:hypothetical protein
LGTAAVVAVAVKTEPLDSFTLRRFIKRRETVTSHAGLILRRQQGELFVLLMAHAALFADGDGYVDAGLSKTRLVVRLVATSAVPVARGIADLFGAVPALIQVVEDIVVARYALTPLESVVRLLVEIGWIGMKCLIGHILVAVQTGVLAMGGTVVLVGIQIPGIRGPRRADTKKGNADHEEKQHSDSTHGSSLRRSKNPFRRGIRS